MKINDRFCQRALFFVLAGSLMAACAQPAQQPADQADATSPQAEEVPQESTMPSEETTDAEAPALPATNFYEIQTPQGRIVVQLYDETPQHRDNFKRLVAEQFYDSTLFHRIIAGFMIQGGDPNSRDDNPENDGMGGPGYTLPAEINPSLFHKRGALAAARQGDGVNPERRSSGSQFYIVHGTPLPEAELDLFEQQLQQAIPDSSFRFSAEARSIYTSVGGAPSLDMLYTVFGEVVEGLDVLDRIARVSTPRTTGQPALGTQPDRPFDDVPMVIRPLPAYPQ